MSTPRYRSAPPSLSGSAISVSKAITPSSPGLKSDIGVCPLFLVGATGHLASCAGPGLAPHENDKTRSGPGHRRLRVAPPDWHGARIGTHERCRAGDPVRGHDGRRPDDPVRRVAGPGRAVRPA